MSVCGDDCRAAAVSRIQRKIMIFIAREHHVLDYIWMSKGSGQFRRDNSETLKGKCSQTREIFTPVLQLVVEVSVDHHLSCVKWIFKR